MKKVININFQGRVIPIEETAFEILKQYIESLRKYFINEEGRDEIINDIEGRIGELFSERLKSGVTCITDADVQSVIVGMGRPEDFDAEEGEIPPNASQLSPLGPASQKQGGRGSLYRNADDRILGGVCSGLANYFNIDPVIMRIIFVVLFGALFWVYILLWVIVPSRSVQSNITKRLYRNPDNKVIAGVCGGIAAYFNIDVWIPRLIFALPFILALVSGGFNMFWWDWDFGFMPRIISGSFGWTLFITYIILWIAVPFAQTSSEKLEMRGEKVDLNTIRNTVKEDLESFKTKAEKWGTEVKETARQFGQQASARAGTISTEAGHAARNSSRGIAHAIGVLFKAFFILIFAGVAVVLFSIFIGLLFGGIAMAPLKDFIIEGPVQNILIWATLFLFFVIPMIALITWGIRRIIGVRSGKHYIGFTLAGLWIIGLISGIILLFSVLRNFRNNIKLNEEMVSIVQPAEKMYVDVDKSDWKQHSNRFFGMDVDDDWPVYTISDDSLLLNTVRISMVKSNDSLYHVYTVRGSRGSNRGAAAATAERIVFEPSQQQDHLILPRGFFISRENKYRNQRVWVIIEVPVGKGIVFNKNISYYDWFEPRFDDRDWDRRWDWNREWREYDRDNRSSMFTPLPGREYIMNADGRAERADN